MPGFYYTATCNVTMDSSCAPCSACPAGTFQTSPCISGSVVELGQDRVCAPCATCELGVTYQSGGCVNGEPLECSPCNSCSGTLRACTLTSNAVCVEGMSCRKNYTFAEHAWITAEERCPQGQYLLGVEISNITLQKSKRCEPCPPFLHGPNGLWCEPCRGYKLPYWDATACTCGEGTVPDEQGDCWCPPGHSFTELGCQRCAQNTYSNASLRLRDDWYYQEQLCSPCPNGYFFLETGATACAACERGKYREGASYTCTACATGSWATDPTNSTSCTACEFSCQLGFYHAPCPANSDPSLYECLPCPPAPTYASYRFVLGGGEQTSCAWDCAEGFFRTEQGACQECSTRGACEPGYNLTLCTDISDAHCDEPCQDPDKPLLNSAWLRGCEWGCVQGYERVKYDYVLWVSYDCAPAGSAVYD